MFFDKTCTIYQTTYQKIGGSSKRVNTAIYTDIECNFEVKKISTYDDNLGKNAINMKYIVVVPLQYNLIREDYIVELIDPDLGSRGKYIVTDIEADRSVGGEIDCITFMAKDIEGQQQ